MDYCKVHSATQPNLISSNSFFFHSNRFAFRNDDDAVVSFEGRLNKQPVLRIQFQASDIAAISLQRSPFGSIDFHPDVSRTEIKNFILSFSKNITSSERGDITIKSYPRVYDTVSYDIIDSCLLECDYQKTYEDVCQYVGINSQSFIEKVTPAERRYINKSYNHTTDFRLLQSEEIPEGYRLIKESRDDKGYPVTMSLEELSQTISTFPDNYLMFGLFYNDRLVASSVCIRVNAHVLYDFYHGDNLEYRKLSPIVALLAEIYDYAALHGFGILDLGVSTNKGVVNPGLFNFKKNLGAFTSEKATYRYLS